MADFQWNFDANAQSAERAGTIIYNLNQTTIKLTQSTKKSEEQNTRWQQSWTRMAGVFNTWNKALRFAVDDIKKLGQAATFVIRKVIDVANSFEGAENTIKGFLADESAKVIARVKEMARETQFTASQVGEAAVSLIRAGRDAAQTFAELPAVLKAAAANMISLSKAADIGTVVVNMFAESGITMKDAMEILTAAAKSGPVTFTELGRSLRNVGPIAVQLGLDLTDTAAVLTKLAAVTGETAGRAGTRMAMFLTRLTALTPAARKHIEDLGITLEDSQGKFLPLATIVDQFREKLAGIPSDAQKAQVMKDIFGRAFSSVIPIINAGGDALRDMSAQITAARSTMETLQDIRMESLTGALAKVQSAAEGFWLTMKDILSGRLTSGFTLIAETINQVTDAFVAFQQSGDYEALFQSLSDAVDAAMQRVREQLQELKPIFLRLWDELGAPVFERALEFGTDIGIRILEGLVNVLKKGAKAIPSALLTLQYGGELQDPTQSTNPFTRMRVAREREKTLEDLRRQEQNLPGGETQEQQAEQAEQVFDWEKAVTEQKAAQEVLNAQALADAEAEVARQDEILGLENEQVTAQRELLEGKQRQAALTDDITASERDLTLTLAEQKSAFEKYILEPWDQFKQKLLDVRSKFEELIGKMKSTRVSILERVGLLTADQATDQRARLQQETFKQTQSRLHLAQSPEERARLQEQLAEQAAVLAEQSPEGAGTDFARQAKAFIDAAIKSRQEQQEIEERKIAIDKQLAEDNVKTLKDALPGVQTAEEQVTILQQLSAALQQLGRVDEAAGLQAQLQASQRQAAGEQVELLKLMLQELKIANDQRVKKSDEQRDELRRLREAQGSGGGLDPYNQGAMAF